MKRKYFFLILVIVSMNVKAAVLYDFERGEKGHSFDIRLDSNKKHLGEFTPQKYYNFDIDNMPLKDWSAFNRLEMDVHNPENKYVDFFLTVGDDKTTNYWSGLNHKQKLGPGWNHLSFSLTDPVGERGSNRSQRLIDLKKIKKFFLIVDPDEKDKFSAGKFLIDNLSLHSSVFPNIPTEVKCFDFSSETQSSGSFIPVTDQSLYKDSAGFGFVNPNFWRSEDSIYASSILRDTIAVLGGSFKVKLPNGTYFISLNIESLGYWDVPFWSYRSVKANGVEVIKQIRNTGNGFLKDLLRFESIIPSDSDHPYDLYQKVIFRSIEKKVEVKDGFLKLDFEGDETGVSLNSLIIWPENKNQEARVFLKALDERYKNEFNWMSRSLGIKKAQIPNDLTVDVILPELTLSPYSSGKKLERKLSFFNGRNDSSYQIIEVSGKNIEGPVNFSFELKNGPQKLDSQSFMVREVIYQYTSPDMNHETYLITGKYLRDVKGSRVVLKKNQVKHLWISFHSNGRISPGKYEGHFAFGKIKIPLDVTIKDFELPKLDFPVGFFGLDPLPYSYFKGREYEEIRKKFRYKALERLSQSGFTTFTGLPEVRLNQDKKEWSLDTFDLEELLKKATALGFKGPFYSYGGTFPKNLLDLTQIPEGMSEEVYHQKISHLLKPLLTKKDAPQLIYTFSDEAGGYSDQIASDIERAKKLKKNYPFLTLGGFGSFAAKGASSLNQFFQHGFYSSIKKNDLAHVKADKNLWGFYNASPGNFDDPRFAFGPGLFVAQKSGLHHYLEWNSGFNNYPYYDFDGRESDVSLFYPSTDMNLYSSLRFELSTEGLTALRKLLLLERTISSQKKDKVFEEARTWLSELKIKYDIFSREESIRYKKFNFQQFSSELNQHLNKIF
jgi:hypothetical protein